MRRWLLAFLGAAGLACAQDITAPIDTAQAVKRKCRPVRVVVTPKSAADTAGDSVSASASVKDACGHELTNVRMTWTSRNPAVVAPIADTTKAVMLHLVGAGSTRVVVSSSQGGKDSLPVTVTAVTPPPPPTSCVPTATFFCPGDSVAAKVQAAGSGATLTFAPGLYRFAQVVPLANQRFIGQPGAVLSGARILTGATSDGAGHWYFGGQTQEGTTNLQPTRCLADHPGCYYNEELWIDGVYQQHMTSLAAVAPGKWYFDYAADRIYIAVDPAGHTIETSVTSQAFKSSAGGVVIKHFTVEKYASPAQNGCINGGPGWTVDSNEVRWCHGVGIKLTGSRSKMRWNYVHHTGQLGVAMNSGDSSLVLGNEIAYNGQAGYQGGWEAGGSKFVLTTDLVVRENNVHHNLWNGLWQDINNTNTRFEANHVWQNASMGIHCEISWGCIVIGNVIDTNGWGATNVIAGSGIVCSATADCDFENNIVRGNRNNGILLYQADRSADQPDPLGRGDHLVVRALVKNNTIIASSGQNGFRGNYEIVDFTLNRNNCFVGNQWFFPANTTKYLTFNVGGVIGLVSDSSWKTSGCNSGEVITR